MKILHLLYESHGDYFGIGGVGTRAYEIYRHLKERHDITLLCKRYPGAKDGEINGFKHIFIGTESKNLTRTFLSYAYKAARFVIKFGYNYDIIIEEFSPAIPTFLHSYKRRPFVLQVQGYTGRLYFRKYNPAYALILYCLEHLRPRFYENFIFINTSTVKKLLSGNSPLPSFRNNPPVAPPLPKGGNGGLFSLKSKKCIGIIPNGISPELLNVIPEKGDYILYFGRIDIKGKGLDVLIKAYREFYKSFPGTRLVIAGDGRDMERFKAELMKLPEGIRKNIDLTGWVSGDEKTEIIRKSLFCVFPSRHEVHSIAFLETMACGKAVIVSGIPGFDQAVKDGAGIAFRTGDDLSLAQSMKTLMTDYEIGQMGQKGRDSVKEFTWDSVALKYEEFISQTLKNWHVY